MGEPFLKGWPVGKYRVELYVNDELATTTKFTIEASKSDKGSEEEESSKDWRPGVRS